LVPRAEPDAVIGIRSSENDEAPAEAEASRFTLSGYPAQLSLLVMKAEQTSISYTELR
jgi:hypothetical protein